MTSVPLGFLIEPLEVPVERILLTRKSPHTLRNSTKFKQIRASIEEIGLIEPLSVTATEQSGQHYVLLDGHVRLMVLQDLNYRAVPCLVATDDEGYTYNNRVNRLSSLQEHVMIRRAIERGVAPERLAKALNVDVRRIHFKATMLEGLCPETIELLKDQQFPIEVVRALRKMKPARQIEAIELMVAANRLTSRYAQALLLTTPPTLLVEGKKPAKISGISPEQMAKMEREMTNLQERYKLAEQSYGHDVLDLVLARGYLVKLLDNNAATRYLRQSQPDMLAEFEAIVQTVSLE